MKTLIGKSKVKKAVLMLSVVMLVMSISSVSAFAAVSAPSVKSDNRSISVSNLPVGKNVEIVVVDAEGNPVTIGIERVPTPTTKFALAATASTTSYKVYAYGGAINAHFYMNITNNKVTSVQDEWILIIGGSASDTALTNTSTYGKLSFMMTSYLGLISANCWLKGTVTGSNNGVTLSLKF